MKTLCVRVFALVAVFALCVAPSGCGDDDAGSGSGQDGDIGWDPDGGNGGGDGGIDQPPQCTRRVFVDDVVNARGLGAQPLSGGRFVDCDRVLRGGDLGGLGNGGCAEFSDLSIQAVVDLRASSVQQNDPPPLCVTQQAQWVQAAMPKLLPDNEANYIALLDETAAVAAIFAALGDPANYPVYVHCVIGRDRASVATALVLLALGAGRQTVVDEFLLSEDAGVLVKVECIQALLDEIDNRGSIEAYLSSVGVTTTQLDVLRAQASTQP